MYIDPIRDQKRNNSDANKNNIFKVHLCWARNNPSLPLLYGISIIYQQPNDAQSIKLI